MKGRVTWWNNSSNCGFIEINEEEFFVHLEDNSVQIHDDEIIEFSMEQKHEGLFIYNLKEVI